jgi:formylmethanofuran dehydrogenase subunit C
MHSVVGGASMVHMGILIAAGELVVVETEDDWFLGTAEMNDGQVIVRNGYVGRPTILAVEDIERVIPAAEHDDVTIG